MDTYWDFGISDETVILFVQNCGQEVHIIDMYRNQGEGLNHYARILKEKVAENKQTRLEIAKDLGIPFRIVPNIPFLDGVELVRKIFPRLRIDSKKCLFFIKAAENYYREHNEKLNVYSDRPVHDWSSHAMDALRYLAIIQNKRRNKSMTEEEANRLQEMYQVRY